MSTFCLSDTLKEKLSQAEADCGGNEKLMSLSCNYIDTWEYRDRKKFELGDIVQLGHSIKTMGQSQPIVVVNASNEFRPFSNQEAQYVVIAGYRRWMACKMENIPIQAIVKSMTFEAAIACLISENEEKQNVSDYSLGLFYYNLLQSERITQEQLGERLDMSSSKLNSLLAFGQLPEKLWSKMTKLSTIKATTAAKVRKYWNLGKEYQKGLMEIAPLIGKTVSSKRWEEALSCLVSGAEPKPKVVTEKIYYDDIKLMSINKGRIRLDKKIASHQNFPELREKIEKLMVDFAKQNLKK